MINSRRNEIHGLNDVVNSTDLRKRIINVDSRFRANLVYPFQPYTPVVCNPVCDASSVFVPEPGSFVPSPSPASDFTYPFEHPYKNVIRLRVASVEIPNVWYDFSKANYSNTSFVITAADISSNIRTATILIADGNYTNATLISAIQTALTNQLQTPYGMFFSILQDPVSSKVSIIFRGVAAPGAPNPTQVATPFHIQFLTNPLFKAQPFNYGLGYNLGFLIKDISGTTVYDISGYAVQGTSIINTSPDNYIFLAINDYNTVEQQINKTTFSTLAKIIVNTAKNQTIYDDGRNLLSNDIIYPSPVDLKQIKVRLLNTYGQPLDLVNSNFSFSLEITEVANVKMYEFYRNYIWLGTIPSLPTNVTGSGQGLLGGKGP
jgi:hypothetical protein